MKALMYAVLVPLLMSPVLSQSLPPDLAREVKKRHLSYQEALMILKGRNQSKQNRPTYAQPRNYTTVTPQASYTPSTSSPAGPPEWSVRLIDETGLDGCRTGTARNNGNKPLRGLTLELRDKAPRNKFLSAYDPSDPAIAIQQITDVLDVGKDIEFRVDSRICTQGLIYYPRAETRCEDLVDRIQVQEAIFKGADNLSNCRKDR